MNSDIIQIYEANLYKNYNLLDSEISKSQICEEECLEIIIDSIDNLYSLISKKTKDYVIGLTLIDNKKDNFKNGSNKIKNAELKLKDYQKKIKNIKEKHKKKKIQKKEATIEYAKDDKTQKIEYDSFNKLSQAITVTAQIENNSGNILVDLNGQTNIMKDGVRKIGTMNEDLDNSKTYINKMISRQNYDNKIIIYVGLFLFMICLLIFLYKIYSKVICK